MLRNPFHILVVLALGFLVCATGCKSDDAAQKDQRRTGSINGPNYTTSEEDGFIVERYTLDDDDEPDVIKYFETYPDPDDKDVTRRRLRRKKIDVNSDGQIDIVREYDKEGTPKKEEVDVNLDGVYDARNFFDNGELVRKELLGDDGETIVETRYYSDGTIMRVEKDRNTDGKVDYWEYYEQGTLDRIGRDLNGDGSADKWTRR
ncbi:MAG: hypothetical protein ACQEVA_01600 [Myxococcota bacterium]